MTNTRAKAVLEPYGESFNGKDLTGKSIPEKMRIVAEEMRGMPPDECVEEVAILLDLFASKIGEQPPDGEPVVIVNEQWIDRDTFTEAYWNEDDGAPPTEAEWAYCAERIYLPDHLWADYMEQTKEDILSYRDKPKMTLAYAPMEFYGDTPFIVGRFIDGNDKVQTRANMDWYKTLDEAETAIYLESKDCIIIYQVGDNLNATRDDIVVAMARQENAEEKSDFNVVCVTQTRDNGIVDEWRQGCDDGDIGEAIASLFRGEAPTLKVKDGDEFSITLDYIPE